MRRLLTVLLLAVAATGLLWSPARAHNVLIGSDPKDGAALTAAPERVTLVFDQAVRQGYAQVGVTSADGGSWADGAASVAAERVSVQVKPLPAGSYVVGYRILSSDGHPVTGKISFTVTGGAAAAPAARETAGGSDAAAAEAAANGGAGMAVLWVLGALIVLAAGTIVALRRSTPASPATAPAEPAPPATAPAESAPPTPANSSTPTPDSASPTPAGSSTPSPDSEAPAPAVGDGGRSGEGARA
ncbi:copper resistance CopC family protein [Nonomuraea sp. NPDC049421]|uniref:copper resistance CopC family protein n=1 Tax=Nonomuraea sp. NPDC049421 TaxID=3155275 RepID=UPI00343EF900